eukprot:CAMPEP_0196655074 /NCGR_PEP_ID=MMETSP1086-20130531/4829_1 /TAXON_ID=77921 /ORGANISM="Cyanoptyche  gloeocystis , Strain SAG4.97" /LENGTH=130 /DNA_ID=CAMNT_0041987189 /DNA_START=92 /DNA_END=482 /DNA_ORIENTATION=-
MGSTEASASSGQMEHHSGRAEGRVWGKISQGEQHTYMWAVGRTAWKQHLNVQVQHGSFEWSGAGLDAGDRSGLFLAMATGPLRLVMGQILEDKEVEGLTQGSRDAPPLALDNDQDVGEVAKTCAAKWFTW